MSDWFAFVVSRDWVIYPFIPPLFSLFLTLVLGPVHDKLFQERLQDLLDKTQLSNSFPLVNGVAQDRALQIAYLTGFPSFFVSVIVTTRTQHEILLQAVFVIGICLGLPAALHVFLKPPSFHSTTLIMNTGVFRYFGRKNWTYLKFYSRLLSLLNLATILLIVITLPPKHA